MKITGTRAEKRYTISDLTQDELDYLTTATRLVQWPGDHTGVNGQTVYGYLVLGGGDDMRYIPDIGHPEDTDVIELVEATT